MTREQAIKVLDELLEAFGNEPSLYSLENAIDTIKYELQGKQEESQQKIWKPKTGESYWFVQANGTISYTTWEDSSCDGNRWAMGNVFKTQAEAEFEVERLKVIAEWKRLAETSRLNNADEDDRRGICHGSAGVTTENLEYSNQFWQNEFTFFDWCSAELAIEEIGEDRIKLFYFGIGKDEWIKEREQ